MIYNSFLALFLLFIAHDKFLGGTYAIPHCHIRYPVRRSFWFAIFFLADQFSWDSFLCYGDLRRGVHQFHHLGGDSFPSGLPKRVRQVDRTRVSSLALHYSFSLLKMQLLKSCASDNSLCKYLENLHPFYEFSFHLVV